MIDEIANAIAKQLWGAAQRIGNEIAELPLDRRDAAFSACEKGLRQVAVELGLPADRAAGLIKIQMEAIRAMVTTIDAGCSSTEDA